MLYRVVIPNYYKQQFLYIKLSKKTCVYSNYYFQNIIVTFQVSTLFLEYEKSNKTKKHKKKNTIKNF